VQMLVANGCQVLGIADIPHHSCVIE